MKNTDYNLNIEYELKIMSSLELRKKIMKDNNLTEEDIFLHYSLNNIKQEEIECININNEIEKKPKYSNEIYSSILIRYQLYKKGFKSNKKVKMLLGYKPKDTLNTTNDEYNIYYDERYMYEEISDEDAVNDVINYNMKLYNKDRNIMDEKYKQCIENATIVINEKLDGKYELIDGFYRILYKNVDCNVIVKVYKNITDEQWFKLMINCNYWKSNVNRHMFYDRGFILGLRCRYGIKMEDYIYVEYELLNQYNGLIDLMSDTITPIRLNHYSAFYNALENKGLSRIDNNIFITNDTNLFKNKVLLNKYFVNDLKMIKEYLEYLPENILQLKKVKDSNVFSTRAYQKFISNLLQLIYTYRVKYSNEDMNELPKNLIDIIFEDKEIKDSFVKATSLVVNGTVDNRLELLLPNLMIILNKVLRNKE